MEPARRRIHVHTPKSFWTSSDALFHFAKLLSAFKNYNIVSRKCQFTAHCNFESNEHQINEFAIIYASLSN